MRFARAAARPVLEDLDAATDALDNARTNIDILHKLAADTLDGLGVLAPAPEGHPDVEAPTPPDESAPRPDFTAKQVAMLVERFNATPLGNAPSEPLLASNPHPSILRLWRATGAADAGHQTRGCHSMT